MTTKNKNPFAAEKRIAFPRTIDTFLLLDVKRDLNRAQLLINLALPLLKEDGHKHIAELFEEWQVGIKETHAKVEV